MLHCQQPSLWYIAPILGRIPCQARSLPSLSSQTFSHHGNSYAPFLHVDLVPRPANLANLDARASPGSLVDVTTSRAPSWQARQGAQQRTRMTQPWREAQAVTVPRSAIALEHFRLQPERDSAPPAPQSRAQMPERRVQRPAWSGRVLRENGALDSSKLRWSRLRVPKTRPPSQTSTQRMDGSPLARRGFICRASQTRCSPRRGPTPLNSQAPHVLCFARSSHEPDNLPMQILPSARVMAQAWRARASGRRGGSWSIGRSEALVPPPQSCALEDLRNSPCCSESLGWVTAPSHLESLADYPPAHCAAS